MAGKRGFFVILLAFMAFFTFAVPSQALASDTGSVADVCGAAGSNTVDTTFGNVVAASGTRVSQDVTNFWTGMQKLDPSNLQCIKTLRSIYQGIMSSVNGVSDPLGLILGIVGPMIISIVNQVCNMVMSDVMQVVNAVKSMLHICIPTSSFGFGLNLHLPHGCSSGTQIPLLSGTGSGMAPTYGNTWYK